MSERQAGGQMSQCGCEIQLTPCEKHSPENLMDDEWLHVDLSVVNKYSRTPMNRHGVNLERVQRCHLDLDEEPMDFSEKTIADMLQDVADTLRHGHEAFVCSAVANALRDSDGHHKLSLNQKQRGKWKSPADQQEMRLKHLYWLVEVDKLEAEGWPTDAAVHHVAAQQGVSVATVYGGMRDTKLQRETARAIADFLDAKVKPSQD